jgi:hypothetical protein
VAADVRGAAGGPARHDRHLAAPAVVVRPGRRVQVDAADVEPRDRVAAVDGEPRRHVGRERRVADVVDVHPLGAVERAGRHLERTRSLGHDRARVVADEDRALEHPARHAHDLDAFELSLDDAHEADIDAEPGDRHRGGRRRAAPRGDALDRDHAVVRARVPRQQVDRVPRGEPDADDHPRTTVATSCGR